MRIVLIALAMLLLLGCIQQVPAESNLSGSPIPTNASGPMPNVTALPQNLTSGEPMVNESNMTLRNASAGVSNTVANATTQRPALRFGNYSLVLDDVSIVSSPSAPCGIFSVDAMNGSTVDRLILCPEQSRIWIAPDGHAYRIFVEKVAAGYGGVEWADVIIYG